MVGYSMFYQSQCQNFQLEVPKLSGEQKFDLFIQILMLNTEKN